MRYFGRAKDKLNASNASWEPLGVSSNYGAGFTIDDETTMEVEREMFNECMDSATHWVQRVDFAGSLKNLRYLTH